MPSKKDFRYFKACEVCGEPAGARSKKELELKRFCSNRCSGISRKLEDTSHELSPLNTVPPELGGVKYGSKYFVYPDGRIWKCEHETVRSDGVVRRWKAKWQPTRVREEGEEGGGYEYADLDGKTLLVHRVVAQCFIENPNNLPEVNHINGVRSDNRVENLEWVDSSGNKLHAYSILNRTRKGKLSDEERIEVARLRNEEELPLKVIAETFRINFRTVSDIAHGNRFVLRKENARA